MKRKKIPPKKTRSLKRKRGGGCSPSFVFRQFHISRKLYYTLLPAIAAGYAYLFFFSPAFTVQNISVIIANESEPEMRKTIEEKLNEYKKGGRGFLSVSRNNTILFSKKAAKDIVNSITAVTDIKIEKKLPNTIQVQIREELPSVVWKEGETRYLLNEDGAVIKKIASNSSLWMDLTIIENATSTNSTLSTYSQAIPKDVVQYSRFFSELFSRAFSDFILTKIIYNTDVPFEIRARTSEGWSIYLDIRNDPSNTIIDIQTALNQKIRTNRLKLKYLDARIPERIYYKLN